MKGYLIVKWALIALIVICLAGTAWFGLADGVGRILAAPVDPYVTLHVRPNEPVSIRCDAPDEWIVNDVGGGELVVTCRIWLSTSEVNR